MSANELKEVMAEQDWTSIDVASKVKVSLKTVDRYLAGREVRPVVEAAFERLIKDAQKQGDGSPPDQAA